LSLSATDPEIVRSIASNMRVLDGDDRLRPLDSLTMIEFVTAIEDATGVDLLGIQLTIEHFVSVGSVVSLLAQART
jgi:acyl carrier protein